MTGYSQRSFPVAREIAYTLAYRSCRYTTPFTTTGAAASDPAYLTPVAAVPASLNVHASRSVPTFAAEIRDPAASRVLARSPFGYAHDPAGRAAPANVLLAGAGGVGGAELHPAAITAAPAMPARPEVARPNLAVRFLIKTTF